MDVELHNLMIDHREVFITIEFRSNLYKKKINTYEKFLPLSLSELASNTPHLKAISEDFLRHLSIKIVTHIHTATE